MSQEFTQCEEPAGVAAGQVIRLVHCGADAWKIQAKRGEASLNCRLGQWHVAGAWVETLDFQSAGAAESEAEVSLVREPHGVWHWEAERSASRAFMPTESLNEAHLLLADGRLCVCRQWGLRQPKLELVDWTSGGPFLLARPTKTGWTIYPTLAGALLPDWEHVALLWCVLIAQVDQSVGET